MPRKGGSGKKSGGRSAVSATEEKVTDGEEEEEKEENREDWKFGRRKIQSNWEKYRSPSPVEYEDSSSSTDFASLLNAPADCNYFRFKHEKNWESEALNNRFNNGNSLFNLNLEMLTSGLACIPFYERIGIDRSELSEADIEKCDARARDAVARYEMVRDKFQKKLALDFDLPHINGEANTTVAVNGEENTTVAQSGKVESKNLVSASPPPEPEPAKPCLNISPEVNTSQSCVKSDDNQGNNILRGEENLEDWLDSVLDA